MAGTRASTPWRNGSRSWPPAMPRKRPPHDKIEHCLMVKADARWRIGLLYSQLVRRPQVADELFDQRINTGISARSAIRDRHRFAIPQNDSVIGYPKHPLILRRIALRAKLLHGNFAFSHRYARSRYLNAELL